MDICDRAPVKHPTRQNVHLHKKVKCSTWLLLSCKNGRHKKYEITLIVQIWLS